jgi:hypothetical protein
MRELGGNQNGQAKYWVFTVNNPTDNDKLLLDNAVESQEFIAYVRYTLEVGDSGTPHFQGHLECSRKVRRNQLLSVLPRAWMAVRKGSFEQAEEYCTKDDDGTNSWSFGERVSKGQGKRSDLDSLALEIRNGGEKRELAETFGKEFIKYSKGIDGYFDLFSVKRFPVMHGPFPWNPELDWGKSQILWGEAGIGKTEYAKHLLPNALFASHLDDLGGYNCDYDGIIFDDMKFLHLPRTAQIHLVDIDNDRSVHIRYKVARIPAHTKKIFLTNETDGYIFDIHDAAIRRRVNVIKLEKLY